MALLFVVFSLSPFPRKGRDSKNQNPRSQVHSHGTAASALASHYCNSALTPKISLPEERNWMAAQHIVAKTGRKKGKREPANFRTPEASWVRVTNRGRHPTIAFRLRRFANVSSTRGKPVGERGRGEGTTGKKGRNKSGIPWRQRERLSQTKKQAAYIGSLRSAPQSTRLIGNG